MKTKELTWWTLQQYSKTFQVPGTVDEAEVWDASLYRIFFGGDQLGR